MSRSLDGRQQLRTVRDDTDHPGESPACSDSVGRATAAESVDLMTAVTGSARQVFWPDDVPVRVATIDRRFAVLYPDVVDAIETN